MDIEQQRLRISSEEEPLPASSPEPVAVPEPVLPAVVIPVPDPPLPGVVQKDECLFKQLLKSNPFNKGPCICFADNAEYKFECIRETCPTPAPIIEVVTNSFDEKEIIEEENGEETHLEEKIESKLNSEITRHHNHHERKKKKKRRNCCQRFCDWLCCRKPKKEKEKKRKMCYKGWKKCSKKKGEKRGVFVSEEEGRRNREWPYFGVNQLTGNNPFMAPTPEYTGGQPKKKSVKIKNIYISENESASSTFSTPYISMSSLKEGKETLSSGTIQQMKDESTKSLPVYQSYSLSEMSFNGLDESAPELTIGNCNQNKSCKCCMKKNK